MAKDSANQESDLVSKIMNMAVIISRCYIDGYTSLKIVFEILEIQSNESEIFLTAPSFLDFLYGVSYQSAIINLSNILVKNKDSVEIYYFQSCLNLINKKQMFGGYEFVEKSIKEIINNYPMDSNFYLGLKELRDGYIVHIDKSKFNSNSGPNKKIELGEIKKAYDCIGGLIGTFFGAMGINPDIVDFDKLEKANIQFRSMANILKYNKLY